VTLDKEDSRCLLVHERVVFAYGPTTRNVVNLIRNLVLAWRVLRQLHPKVIVTTGAGIAVPFAWLARFFGAKVIYIESLTRIDSPSLSCRLIAPVADRLYVQWQELADVLPKAQFVGSVVHSS
jgi:UDP-N-acetylglucosamine:LPS N-acetylglucosamine transferase